ncbi:MAG: YkgJ family cysteine cluster protein [Acidilobaceae archaeon]
MGKTAKLLDFVDFGDICRGCKVNCCRRFYAVLLDEEEKEFDGVASTLKTPLGKVKTLGDPNGKVCPFLSGEGFCKVYKDRPFDCRLWPIMVHYDFETDEYVIVLDLECPAAAEGRIPEDLIKRMIGTVKKAKLDKNWVKKYTLTPWPKKLVELERIKSPKDNNSM